MENKPDKNANAKVKSQPNLIKIIMILASILVVLIVVVAVLTIKAGNDNDTTQTTGTTQTTTSAESFPELIVLSVEEQGEWVQVSTSYCVFSYPVAYADLIHFEARMLDNQAVIEFTTEIDGERYPLYTLIFNGNEGHYLGMLQIESSSYRVSYLSYEIDEAITERWEDTFYAAQETFNDVDASLKQNDGYTPAG